MAATLTQEQRDRLVAEDQAHWRIVDPATGVEFVLVPAGQFEYLDGLDEREEARQNEAMSRRGWEATCRQLTDEETAEDTRTPTRREAAAG